MNLTNRYVEFYFVKLLLMVYDIMYCTYLLHKLQWVITNYNILKDNINSLF